MLCCSLGLVHYCSLPGRVGEVGRHVQLLLLLTSKVFLPTSQLLLPTSLLLLPTSLILLPTS